MKLQAIYNQLHIKKTAKATDLANWYSISDHSKWIDGKSVTFIKVLTCNVKPG